MEFEGTAAAAADAVGAATTANGRCSVFIPLLCPITTTRNCYAPHPTLLRQAPLAQPSHGSFLLCSWSTQRRRLFAHLLARDHCAIHGGRVACHVSQRLLHQVNDALVQCHDLFGLSDAQARLLMSMADGEAVVVDMGSAHSLAFLLEQRGNQLHTSQWRMGLLVAGSPLVPTAHITALSLVGRTVVTPLLHGRLLIQRN